MFHRLASVTLIVLLVNFAVWALVNQSVSERAWGGVINGLSYSGYQAGDKENHRSDADIDRDMSALEGHTSTVRTYGVADGLDRIATIAGRHNIDVNLGAWISPDESANTQELARMRKSTR